MVHMTRESNLSIRFALGHLLAHLAQLLPGSSLGGLLRAGPLTFHRRSTTGTKPTLTALPEAWGPAG